MSVALCLIIPFETEAKLERVLNLFERIAESTLSNERENRAYCWLRKSGQNTLQGPHICGLELYESEKASKITHREGEEYKYMRTVAPQEKLFMQPTNLVYMKPAVANGFLSKETWLVQFSMQQTFYVVIRKYTTKDNDRTKALLSVINDIAAHYQEEEAVLTYLPLESKEHNENEIIVFERFISQEKYQALQERPNELYNNAQRLAETVEVSTWTDGIGHIHPVKS